MASFALATIQDGKDFQAALVIEENLYPLSSISSPLQNKSVKQLLEDWSTKLPLLRDLTTQITTQTLPLTPTPLQSAPLTTPIHHPSKLLAVGANYTSHLQEMGLPAEKWDPMPFFSCPPTTAIVGPGKTVPYPHGTKQFDWECELTVVLGKPLRNASVAEAKDAIAGYTIGLDLSCRDLITSGPKGLMDIMRGKAQDGMKPVGPYFVPKEAVSGDVGDMAVELRVNGEVMIQGSTREMLWKPEECLVEISRVVTLEPGDLVMTGTPAGSAKSHGGRWLGVGDRIEARIGELGVLEVEVV
ncbi:hypothetical protein M409DRAFT_37841 [Zasmidium cellare ATCC 36951]|uniref:Fumarylacetoacetase-like C-terminal domain-containing protein n=1 Tax=Zasmidium cellare ATCC 36951 TaxID=1080233 RepID=A0A6A6C281_ZASCE|nr:uncharacterized protein M409DRAFT_37841 [Zasmidium cellare ATCC 36951]KAF2159829.1 hypothetical protein M409DRAFT_37841 [Zasmidium cellare ATCC 36951]